MTITLELKPEVEANLAAQARVRGIPLDTYLQTVVEDVARTAPSRPPSPEDIEAALDKLAEMGKDLLSIQPREHLSGSRLRSSPHVDPD